MNKHMMQRPGRLLPRIARALGSGIPVSPGTRFEQLYVLAALGTCLVVLAGHHFSQRLEEATRREGWASLAIGADQGLGVRAAAAPNPQLSPPAAEQVAQFPTWVQSVRGTSLWRDAAGADRTASVGQWQFLKVVGADQARVNVEIPEEGGVRGGWIDLQDVGISGPPPSWVRSVHSAALYRSPDDSNPAGTVPQDADLMLLGEPGGARLFVYLPVESTSRRSGYGWIDADAAVPTVAPAGIALPSPNFRPVPIGRLGTYRVRPGDSLVSIAATLGLDRDDLVRRNGLDPTARLLVGQVLQVPRERVESDYPVVGPRRIRDISPGWVSAEYAAVIDEASGQILWAREANTPVAPASLTKIVTTLVVLDHAALTDRVTVRVDSRGMPGSTVMGLHPGEEVTVEDLLYGLMLSSGNDAALALAEHVAGTREAFSRLMNERVRSLGLTGSTFVNPHGLDAPGHTSTAYDMAMAAREGMKHPVFRALSAARSYAGGGYQLGNLNQLLWRYAGADGVKIGYTDAAGRTIVGSATRNGHRVYVAMMRSNDIYADSTALLDWAFASYEW